MRCFDPGEAKVRLPSAAKVVGGVARLLRASQGHRRRLPEIVAFEPGWYVAAVPLAPPRQQPGIGGVDVGRAAGEGLDDGAMDADDVGCALDRRAPAHAQPGGELGPHRGLEHVAEAGLVLLEELGVERPPAALPGVDLGGDHRVPVQLRLRRAVRVLLEDGRRQPAGVQLHLGSRRTDPGDGTNLLKVGQRGSHRGPARRLDVASHLGRVVGDRPQDRHRLGHGEGGVEPSYRRTHTAIGVRPTQLRARRRVLAVEEPAEVLAVDEPVAGGESRLGLRSPPPPRQLTGVHVVVRRATCQPLPPVAPSLVVGEAHVVVGAPPASQARHPEHGGGL